MMLEVRNGVRRHVGHALAMANSAKRLCAMRADRDSVRKLGVASDVTSIQFFNFVKIWLIGHSSCEFHHFESNKLFVDL